MKSKAEIVVLLVIVSFGFAACAVSPAAPAPVPPTPTPVPPTATPVPPTPTPSITVEDLTGIWWSSCPSGGSAYLQFNEDGTFREANAAPWLETAPLEEGQFQIEGTVITFLTSSKSGNCPGQDGSYQIELAEQDQFQLVLQEDACQNRANYMPGDWDRVEP